MHIILSYLNQKPILYIVLITFIFSLITYLSKKTKYFVPLLLIVSSLYFGPLPLLKTILFFLSAYIIGKKIYKDNNLICLILGLLIIIQFHAILSLVVGVQTSQSILYIVESALIIFYRKLINTNLYIKIQESIGSLNIIEIILVFFAFIISSQPQVYWDAVHANLYNAKWYFQNNSLSPIIESISSLFPQNGIMYFSYFFGIGGNKILQIAYLLPLILTIFILKKNKNQVKNKSFFTLSSLLLIATPIFIFESSNGYYDSLITLCGITIIYIFLNKKIGNKEILISAFIIGFATAVKYLPIVLGLIPVFFIFKCKNTFHKKIKLFLITIVLIILPLFIWGTRSYITTKNPFFPFAQYIFPTPNLWSPTDYLENNFMIQTTMSAQKWLLGGFVYYPIETYINTEKFIEGATGYTTRAPIILNFSALILILYSLYKIIRYRKINNYEWLKFTPVNHRMNFTPSLPR